MICVHLKQLLQFCETNELRLGSNDVVRMVCRQCGVQEVCPSMLMEEYEFLHPLDVVRPDSAEAPRSSPPPSAPPGTPPSS